MLTQYTMIQGNYNRNIVINVRNAYIVHYTVTLYSLNFTFIGF